MSHLFAQVRPDAVIHLAALVSVQLSISNPALNHRLNYHATEVIAQLVADYSVPRLVFASTAAVYGDAGTGPITENATKAPFSPYGHAKLASERFLLEFAQRNKTTVRVQRYFNVYGVRQNPNSPYSGVISIFVDRAKRGLMADIFGDGEQTRDFVNVRDVATANVIAATRDSLLSGVANICTGCAVSLNQLWRVIAQTFGLSDSANYGPCREGDIRHSCGDPGRSEHELGFRAAVELGDGIEALKLASDVGPVSANRHLSTSN